MTTSPDDIAFAKYIDIAKYLRARISLRNRLVFTYFIGISKVHDLPIVDARETERIWGDTVSYADC